MFSYLIIIIFLPITLIADEKLRLIRADVLENDIVNGQSVQYLYGNVIFEKGSMVINCDKAFNIEKTGQSSMVGMVKVIDENNSSSGISNVVICFTLTFVPFKPVTKFLTRFGLIFISRINSLTAITHNGFPTNSGS